MAQAQATRRAPHAAAAAPASAGPDIIIDLFAGGGGTSTGCEGACGRSPDIAVNHDAEALALHAANHPATLHLCDDIRQVDVVALLNRPEFRGRRVGLLWASPDCKDHSKAKGGVPKDKNIRGLAWEVLRWVAAIRRATGKPPRAVLLENVEEFQDWGPLHTQGPKAGRVMKHRRKETFRLWKGQLESLGGRVEERELVAAKYGAPTTRKRLYVVCQFEGDPIFWPAPTHGPRQKVAPQGDLFAAPGEALEPYRAAADIIDWTKPIPSIFNRKKALAPKTERRIARGIDRFVIRAHRPFIVPVTHAGDDRVDDSADPLRTVTGAHRGELAAVDPTLTAATIPHLAHGDHPRGAGFRVRGPDEPVGTIHAGGGNIAIGTTVLAGASVGVGGRAGQSPPRGLDQPVNTITAKGDRAVTTAFLNRTDMQSAADRNGIHSPDEPVRTITSAGGFATSTAYLVPRYGEREGQEPRVVSVEGPAPTIVPDGNGGSLAQVFMQKMSENGRGSEPDEPLHTAMAGAPRHYEVAAYLARQFWTGVGSDISEPARTVMADGGGKTQLVTPVITKFHNESVGQSVEDPMPTVTANSFIKRPGGAVPIGIAAPTIDKYYETGVAQEADRPLDAVTSKARFGLAAAFIEQANTGMVGHDACNPLSTIVAGGGKDSGWGATQRLVGADLEPYGAALDAIGAPSGSKRREVLAFLWHHFGTPTDAEWADPVATISGRLRFGLVILDGVVWQIVDIGMRMLTPRELYSAQGFPADYCIELTLANGKPLTKTAQTRMAGNSVSPPVAKALIAANCPWLRERERVAA